MNKIGEQTGIEAARIRENEFHPTSNGSKITAWDKRARTLATLATDHDETVDALTEDAGQIIALRGRLGQLEARLATFPFAASS